MHVPRATCYVRTCSASRATGSATSIRSSRAVVYLQVTKPRVTPPVTNAPTTTPLSLTPSAFVEVAPGTSIVCHSPRLNLKPCVTPPLVYSPTTSRCALAPRAPVLHRVLRRVRRHRDVGIFVDHPGTDVVRVHRMALRSARAYRCRSFIRVSKSARYASSTRAPPGAAGPDSQPPGEQAA